MFIPVSVSKLGSRSLFWISTPFVLHCNDFIKNTRGDKYTNCYNNKIINKNVTPDNKKVFNENIDIEDNGSNINNKANYDTN